MLPALDPGRAAEPRRPFPGCEGRSRRLSHPHRLRRRVCADGRHICIVPDGSPKKLALPFEGDDALAKILSKAMLLSRDDEITDPVILRQLRAERPTFVPPGGGDQPPGHFLTLFRLRPERRLWPNGTRRPLSLLRRPLALRRGSARRRLRLAAARRLPARAASIEAE